MFFPCSTQHPNEIIVRSDFGNLESNRRVRDRSGVDTLLHQTTLKNRVVVVKTFLGEPDVAERVCKPIILVTLCVLMARGRHGSRRSRDTNAGCVSQASRQMPNTLIKSIRHANVETIWGISPASEGQPYIVVSPGRFLSTSFMSSLTECNMKRVRTLNSISKPAGVLPRCTIL